MTTERATDSVAAEPRFQTGRPPDLRRATLGHRYAHHIRVLPERLERLARSVPLPPRARILDYGCAEVPYRHFFPADADYVPADLADNPHATLVLDPDGTVPANDGSFDLVVSTQVLEHVVRPDVYVAECFRVLRPGGRLLLSTHGVFVYHPDPDDYWRWTCAGLKEQVARAGFRVERFEGIIGLIATGLQLVQDGVYWRVPRFLRFPIALVMQALVALADRLEGEYWKSLNAQVFGVVAVKP